MYIPDTKPISYCSISISIRYEIYQTPNLSGTEHTYKTLNLLMIIHKPIRYLTYQIQNRSDTEHTVLETEPVRYKPI